MVATMYAADGVGLAACQIGVDLAVFVFDCPDASGAHTVGVVCNPVLTLPEGRDRQLDDDDEGCLSLPGRLRRPAPDPTAPRSPAPAWTASRSPSAATGCWPAASSTRPTTLRGTVFGDRLATKLRKKLQKQHDQAAEEFPEGWPA